MQQVQRPSQLSKPVLVLACPKEVPVALMAMLQVMLGHAIMQTVI